MKAAKETYNQIKQLTIDLIGTPLCNDQNFPQIKGTLDNCKIEIANINVAAALKNRPYHELFSEMDRSRSFNIKLLDGALVQFLYEFERNMLVRHRLCFFPNPVLFCFQDNPEEYLEDEIYIDITDHRKVVVPLRFDYDNNLTLAKNIDHPFSHLTIGQYQNCRIPVARPLTPCQFLTFIIRNFYHTAYCKYCDQLTTYLNLHEQTITEEEQKILHIGIY